MDAVVNEHLMAEYLLHTLNEHHTDGARPPPYVDHYGIEGRHLDDNQRCTDVLSFIDVVAAKIGCVGFRGKVNEANVIAKILKDYRSGLLGRLTLDRL